jgi:hypothetical protein
MGPAVAAYRPGTCASPMRRRSEGCALGSVVLAGTVCIDQMRHDVG